MDGEEVYEEVEDKNCPFCGGRAELSPVAGKIFWKYRCDCGSLSKLFQDKWEAREWFNTRSGKCAKKYKRPKIEVGPVEKVVSDKTLKDGKIERTPEDVGHIEHPREKLEELQKEADRPKPF